MPNKIETNIYFQQKCEKLFIPINFRIMTLRSLIRQKIKINMLFRILDKDKNLQFETDLDHISEYYYYKPNQRINLLIVEEKEFIAKQQKENETNQFMPRISYQYGNYISGFTEIPLPKKFRQQDIQQMPKLVDDFKKRDLNFSNVNQLINNGFIKFETVNNVVELKDYESVKNYDKQLDKTNFLQPSQQLFKNFNLSTKHMQLQSSNLEKSSADSIVYQEDDGSDADKVDYALNTIAEITEQQFISDRLKSYQDLKTFDLSILTQKQNHLPIQDQLYEKLLQFEPRIQQKRIYQPTVLLPGSNYSYLKINFSLTRVSGQSEKFEQFFNFSPYLSADEIAANIFRNTKGIATGSHVLKVYDQEFYFVGMRQMIEYDYVRDILREQKKFILTAVPLTQYIIEIDEYYFDENRAYGVYDVPEKQYQPDQELQRYKDYVANSNFTEYSIDLYEKFKTNSVDIQSQALVLQSAKQTQKLNSQIEQQRQEDDVNLDTKIDIQCHTEQMEITIKQLFIPVQAQNLIQTDIKHFEHNINDYKEKFFKTQTDVIDHNWNDVIEKEYANNYPKLESTVLLREKAKQQVYQTQQIDQQFKKDIFYKFRRHFLQLSVYLVYGSKNLSKCLYTSYFNRGEIIYTEEKNGMQVDINETFLLPISYSNIPPGTKLAVTVWMIDLGKLAYLGNDDDCKIFQKLILNEIPNITMDQLSNKSRKMLQQMQINPKSKNGNPYYEYGYKPLASVLCDLYDINNSLRGGKNKLMLWPNITSYWLGVLSLHSMNQERDAIILDIEIPIPPIFTRNTYSSNKNPSEIRCSVSTHDLEAYNSHQDFTIYTIDTIRRNQDQNLNKTAQQILSQYSNKPVATYLDSDFQFLYKYKNLVVDCPEILPTIIHAVPFHSSEQYKKFMFLVQQLFNQILPIQTSMELLDFEYPDTTLRNLAVYQLEFLQTHELKMFYLQLVQVLKFERSTQLFKILIEQAVNNFKTFGFDFYWALKNEMRHSICHANLYKLMCLKILKNISQKNRNDLLVTEQMITQLALITRNIYESKFFLQHQKNLDKSIIKSMQSTTLASKLNTLNNELKRANIEYFKLPISYYTILDQFLVKKSRIMDSKKAPLMLFVHKRGLGMDDMYVDNTVSSYYITMFKTGDDIRQDALVIQCMQVMNNIWLSNNFNLHMKLYQVIPTGPQEGMIEIVPNSTTLAKITKEYSGALSAFSKLPINYWIIKENNLKNYMQLLQKKQDVSELNTKKLDQETRNQTPKEIYASIVNNFSMSTAAFCVSTYLLGIGDRHNDNVMCSRNGHFFHIDFGHFMGNFKQKLGFKREKAPFFFTPDMQYVMQQYDSLNNAESYKRFIQTSQKVYNLIRQKGYLLLVMNKMLVATGIEELSQMQDMDWLVDKLNFTMSREEADNHFEERINESVNTWLTKFNNFCHIVAHK